MILPPRRSGRTLASARAVVLAAMLAAAPAAAGAGPAGLALRYDVYYLAFRILSVESATVIDSSGYRMDNVMRTVGLIGALFPWESHASTHGMVEGLELLPGGYRMQSRFRGERRAVELRYADGAAVVERQEGGAVGEGYRAIVPEEMRAGTMDPLTAAVALSHALGESGSCAGTLRVFDGVRRYDLRYEDGGESDLEPGSRALPPRARLCRAYVEPIAGFLESGPGAGEAPRSIAAWLAPPLPGAAPVPLRLDLEGARGTLRAYLESVEPLPDGGVAAGPVE